MESSISLKSIIRAVEDYFQEQHEQYGLNPKLLTIRYVLNWGGFVNASFTISDQQRSYHLKLADDEGIVEQLQRWYDLRSILETRYRAPKIVDWISIPLPEMPAEEPDGEPLEIVLEGMLFEHIPGQKADFAANPALHRSVIDLVHCLHQDQQLAEALREPDDEPLTCADYFLSTYIDRFDEDLLVVAQKMPPFVALETFDWMQSETRHLEALVRESPAFALPVNAPTHGDLWENNVLVTPDGNWNIIDWDDLALGDPALEYSILLSSVWRSDPAQDPAQLGLLPESFAADSAAMERLNLCLRAYVLDQVIDTLADFVEASFVPTNKSDVQNVKRDQHLKALQVYRQYYPQ